MIGLFDSGSGWLSLLAALRYSHPEWSYVYFADYEHCPFWDKTPEEILSYTTSGVQKLFDAGATLVILACNTASVWTLRKLQTEIFPGKKILWVTIPGAEKAIEFWSTRATVFATHQTVKSRAFTQRMNLTDKNISVDEIALPGELVMEIEWLLPVKRCHTTADFLRLMELYFPSWWLCEGDEWFALTQKYFGWFVLDSDCIILGCTHYSYLKKSLEKIFPTITIIDPSLEACRKIEPYMRKHAINILSNSEIIFL